MIRDSIQIKKDDKVKVISGKDKGKVGKVLKVLRKKKSSSRREYQYRQTPYEA